MTRSDLIVRIAAHFRTLAINDSEVSVSLILESITNTLARGERIEIRGFGSFSVNYRPARMGRNPKSGDAVHVPEKYVPHFNAGKELREKVNSQAELTNQFS